MKLCALLLCSLIAWSEVLTINVPAPEYEFINNNILVNGGAYIHVPGVPDVPCRTITVALPPGAIMETVSFSGTRRELGLCTIEPARPMLPFTDINAVAALQELYEHNKKIYANCLYPEVFGRLLSKGGLRKYTLVDIVCYHFAFNSLSRKIYCAPSIDVTIHYRMPVFDSERAQIARILLDDTTYDAIARDIIYNWDDAKLWYAPSKARQAHGYCIIIPASLTNSVAALVAHRQSQGYDVQIVTIEHIDSTTSGDDLPQKIRNYLRANLVDIEFALLVGYSTEFPWRSMVPFNNNPYSPYGHPDYSPIPSDLYYAELTDPDSISWNSDRDSYYGEVFDDYFNLVGDDDPDYHGDIHLGRIPHSNSTTIEDICQKIIAFDNNTDVSYKTAALLAGAVYYYDNEDNTGNSRMDGADWTEELLNDSIFDRAHTITLYEKAGLEPNTYTCTDPLTRNNMISYWQDQGIMYECHHGHNYIYARKVWAWDDGDSIPEAGEMTWPWSLHVSDVSLLDNEHPATTFLRSCLCGNPDVNGLAAQLLHQGASATISSSRISWMTYADPGGPPYHFYNHLLKDTTLSHGLIGPAYDMARTEFMDITSFWLPAYHDNLFGDPAMCQFGRPTGTEEAAHQTIRPLFTVYPNPTAGSLTIDLHSPGPSKIILDAYDRCGCFVQRLYDGHCQEGTKTIQMQLPTGVYFLKLENGRAAEFRKVVVLN